MMRTLAQLLSDIALLLLSAVKQATIHVEHSRLASSNTPYRSRSLPLKAGSPIQRAMNTKPIVDEITWLAQAGGSFVYSTIEQYDTFCYTHGFLFLLALLHVGPSCTTHTLAKSVKVESGCRMFLSGRSSFTSYTRSIG